MARIGQLIAWAGDSALDELCAIGAARANFSAGRCQQKGAFLEAIRDLLVETLECKALTIFLVDETGTRLEESISTGLIWKVPQDEPFYKEGEGVLGGVWKRPEPLLDPGTGKYVCRKSEEAGASTHPSLLYAPMLDAGGGVIGVIRCQNKRGKHGEFPMFSEDDLAVLDSVFRAAVPHLQVLLSKERRVRALRRAAHELNNPLIAVHGAVNKIRKELVQRRGTTELFFSQDYLSDIDSWLALMSGLLDNASALQFDSRKLVLERRRVELFADVFMPAVEQIEKLLVNHHFDRKKINIQKFQTPALWVDKRRFTQVVFNLLTNAIKYAEEEPKYFRVEVSDREMPKHYEIDFCDWGTGIPGELKEAIFLEGVRSPGAEESNVSGDGLGLWIARQILEAHGATIHVAGLSHPTKFTISLPKELERLKASTLDAAAKS